MSGKQFTITPQGDVSDGYHTFKELYEHRCALFIALCLSQPERCVWKKDESTEGWIILYLDLPTGQVSYHIPDHYTEYLEGVVKQDSQHCWDGHRSPDVVMRLDAYSVILAGNAKKSLPKY